MSTTARRYWLKMLRSLGVRSFKATSGLGLPYICHVGDFSGEVPFYSSRHSVEELLLMAAWCEQIENPVIFDVGANNGFIATQLAQLLKGKQLQIYAFEPVPSTFCQLVDSIERLGLGQLVTPVCCALSDSTGICTIAYNPRESLFAQVRGDNQNPRAGNRLAVAPTMTMDNIVGAIGKKPSLIKVDVEGFEPQVLRGAARLLNGDDPPAICFEWNPLTLSEINTSPNELIQSLQAYRFFYVDDFEGQRVSFGTEIYDLGTLTWVCNVFAVPRDSAMIDRWNANRDTTAQLLHSFKTLGANSLPIRL